MMDSVQGGWKLKKHWVAKKGEIKEGTCKIVSVNGLEFGIFNVNNEFYAYRNVCPHAGAEVCRGKIVGTRLPGKVYEYKYGRDQEILRCPWHGWEFDLITGEHLVDPEVKLKRGQLEHERLEKGELHYESEDIYLLL